MRELGVLVRWIFTGLKPAALAAFTFFGCCFFFAQKSQSQNLLTPRDEFLAVLADARDEPQHSIWFYISGLVGGANAGAVMHTGKPLICDTHSFEEIAETEETIMLWLLSSEALSSPDTYLELAVPLAFAARYPCTMI